MSQGAGDALSETRHRDQLTQNLSGSEIACLGRDTRRDLVSFVRVAGSR